MYAENLQGEIVININSPKDLDEISKKKLDLKLYKLPEQERHSENELEIEPEAEPAKLVVKSISVSQLAHSESKTESKLTSKPENMPRSELESIPESESQIKLDSQLESKPVRKFAVSEKPIIDVKVCSVTATASARPLQ